MAFLDIYTVDENKDNPSSMGSKLIKFIDTNKIYILIIISIVTLYFVLLNFGLDVADYTKTQPCESVDQQNMPDTKSQPENETPEEQPTTETPEEQPTTETPEEQPEKADQFTNKEPFTNDLPYQLKNETLNISPDLDYNDFLQKMSLDKDVIQQHNQYVTDRNKITSTASFAPSRSDSQDIVTTWGLARRTYIPIDPSARNIPSQDPEQGSKPVRLQWN
jgi:hypothetical protein